MKRIIALLVALQITLFAQSYNEHILKIEAHIIPKIILMDYQFETKSDANTITIIIIHNENEQYIARKIADLILERYPKGIKEYAIRVKTLSYAEITSQHMSKSNLLYLMDSDKTSVQNAVAMAKRSHTLIFTHDKVNLAYGAHISLLFGKKITPLLNLKLLKDSNISVRPALLSISEIYND